jgi:hypothetical protein
VRLDQTSASPSREQFANLARTWIRLCDDLERSQAFFDALDDETELRVEPDSPEKKPRREVGGASPVPLRGNL